MTDTPHCDFCGRPITGKRYTHRVTDGPPREVPSAVVGTLTIHNVVHRGYACAECASNLPTDERSEDLTALNERKEEPRA